MKIETITDKIIAKADSELKDRIKKASSGLDSLLRNGSNYEISGPSGYDDRSPPFKAQWWRALKALEEAAFQEHFEENRQRAINEFVNKFNALEHQFDELRGQVENS